MNWIRQLFCAHDYRFLRNIWGDEIIACGYKRSLWRCSKCQKLDWRENLVQRGYDDATRDALLKTARTDEGKMTFKEHQYPEGPGTIPPKKWPATEEILTLAQRFNEILKAYGVLFSDDAMRSRLIIDLMSEVTGGTLTVTE